MIAYNNEWLKNLAIRTEANEALQERLITPTEWEDINNKFPTGFYSPNIFIRVGLFLLSLIIVLFSFGIIALLVLDSIERVWGILAILFGAGVYAVLEYMVKTKSHFRSGVDDALTWIAAAFIAGGLIQLLNAAPAVNCGIAFLISCYCMARFNDRGMAVNSVLSVLGIFFFLFSATTTKPLLPFILMAAAGMIYYITIKAGRLDSMKRYIEVVEMIKFLALLVFYISGNYFVVRELTSELFNVRLGPTDSIPFGWLFWLFTILIPIAYLVTGIFKKDRLFVRLGLLLLVVSVITIRYYYPLVSVELFMTVSGAVLLIAAYTLYQYLELPRKGFVYLKPHPAEPDASNLESLIIAETFSPKETTGSVTQFGGGSFGGGGSSAGF